MQMPGCMDAFVRARVFVCVCVCVCVCVRAHVCLLCVSVINRCIPAVFNKIVDMTEEIKTADAKYTITTLFNDTITGSKLENGTQYVLIYILCLCCSSVQVFV